MRTLDTQIQYLEEAADKVYSISTEDEKYEAYSEIVDIAGEIEHEVKILKYILDKYNIDYEKERFFAESKIK